MTNISEGLLRYKILKNIQSLCETRAVYLARLSEHLSELAEISTANSHFSATGCLILFCV